MRGTWASSESGEPPSRKCLDIHCKRLRDGEALEGLIGGDLLGVAPPEEVPAEVAGRVLSSWAVYSFGAIVRVLRG